MEKQTIYLAENQHVGCLQCGLCCRRFFIALMDKDISILEKLKWPAEHRLSGVKPYFFIGKHKYLAQTGEGNCIYLNTETQLCEIHSRFGAQYKPASCRFYPLNITTSFPGDISSTVRFDCPSTVDENGQLLTKCAKDIKRHADELGLKGGFNDIETWDMSKQGIIKCCQGIIDVLNGPEDFSMGIKITAAMELVEKFRSLGSVFMDDVDTIEQVLPTMKVRAFQKACQGVGKGRRLSVLSRIMFRQWLSAYLRRDREMHGANFSRRFKQMKTIGAISFGYGSFADLSKEHPDTSVADAGFFSEAISETVNEDIWKQYLCFVTGRLQTYQFFGTSYYHVNFLDGLQALLQTFPLVLATAKYHASAKNSINITNDDVKYALGAISHSFGRSGYLNIKYWRFMENFFSEKRFVRLMNMLGAYNIKS